SYAKEAKLFKLDDKSIKIIILIGKILLIILYAFIILNLGIRVYYQSTYFGISDRFSITYNHFNNQLGSIILIWLTIISGLFTIISFLIYKNKFSIIGVIALIITHIASLIYLSNTFLSTEFEASRKYIESINILNVVAIIVMITFLIFNIKIYRKEKVNRT
ncbi:MAG TPA: zinc metallopeptidase, partial [Acholeplasma sp.]|nr:zinc metallopeptidase [Acholeplasma sp.]